MEEERLLNQILVTLIHYLTKMETNPIIEKLKPAIAKRESSGSGGYLALGTPTTKGDRAYGKYQVMGANIPTWTKEATGVSTTSDEFLNNPDLQEKVASHRMNELYKKYGNPEDVVSAWFTGGPLKGNENKQDINGTKASDYVKDVLGFMGTKEVNASEMPSQEKLSHEQLTANINAMEQQGAKPEEVQSYLDSLKGGEEKKEKKLSFDDIPQAVENPSTPVDLSAPGHVIEDLKKGDYKGALSSGIRGFANLATFGGSEDLAKGISSPIASAEEKIKGFLGGKDNSKYIIPQTEKEKDQAYSGGSKSALAIGTLASLGAGSGILGASRAKILTTPAVTDNIAVPVETFLNSSKATQLNYLKDALDTAKGAKSALSTSQIEGIIKAIKYLEPSPSWIKSLLKSGFKEATRFALYNALGNKAGGIIHGILHD